jgi:hypothetical protein
MITYHENFDQGSDAWITARAGLLTASQMKLIITPTLKVADNDKSRSHMWELLSQRISKYVEPQYVSDAMLRGHDDELEAKIIYNEKYAPLQDVGFITNDKFGFTLGCSPDSLIAEAGGLEVKSRAQKFQVQTIVEQKMPDDFVIQVQTCLLVSERKWWDFISYSGGLPMLTLRVLPDPVVQDAIVAAATIFEKKLAENFEIYRQRIADKTLRLHPTERRIEGDII